MQVWLASGRWRWVIILIDPRVGSADLIPLFRPYGDVAVESRQLDFGDAAWVGNGADGPVLVGVERKNVRDLVSSMRSKRLSGHQLPGLLRTYDWTYLVVEGVFKPGERGETVVLVGREWRPLTVGSQPILYREIDHYRATLEHVCGVTVARTDTPKHTAAWLVSRYLWWTEKEWNQHQSHVEIYAPYDGAGAGRGGRRGMLSHRTVTLVEKVAAQIPGLDRSAFSVGRHFRSVERMVGAGVEEWEAVRLEQQTKEGRRTVKLGRKRAERIWEELRRG